MKTATKMLLALFCICIGATSALQAQEVTKIRDARALALESEVTVEGILTTPDYNFYDNQFFMQDSTAGISIFIDEADVEGNNQGGNSPFAAGDSIRITGTIINTNGLVQIQSASGSYTILNSGNDLPEPVMITAADLTLDSEYQSMRVKLAPVSLAEGEEWPEDAQTSSGVNVDVVSGDSAFTLRIDRDESFYDGAEGPAGKFQLAGNLGAFFSPQIFPFYEGDITNIYDVHFTVNTATLLDTLKESHFVQIRGAVNGAGGDYLGQYIDWNAQSDLVAENVGGDYWEVDFDMLDGDQITFKVWTGYDEATGSANGDGGWEIINENKDNRTFTATSDTSVVLWSDSETAPFENDPDSVDLYFRVNVGAFVQDGSFDPETDLVGIRGNDQVFKNPGDWSSSYYYLEQEGGPGDNLFYSGTVKVDQEAADTLGSTPYKYVLETSAGVLWDNVEGNADGNRFLDIPSKDSTIHWEFFQQKPPTDAQIVTADISFEVNVAVLEILGYFNSGIGDKVVVRGEPPLDWGTSDFNTATFDDEDVLWRLTQEFTKAVDSEFKYKYYIEYDASRTDETSENYIEAIAENVDFGYEEPVTTGGGDRYFMVTDETSQTTGAQYFNDVNTGAIIAADNTPNGMVSVTFEIDMTNALTAEVPFRPNEDSLYLQLESKYTALTNGFRSGGGYFEDVSQNGTPADIEALRYKPVEGQENIYAVTLDLTLPTLNDFGYVVRYGQPFTDYAGMVVNGSGFAAGRRYYQFIEPTDVADLGEDPFLGQVYESSWPETYTMPRVEWKQSDLDYTVQPDYGSLVSNDEEKLDAAKEFTLQQNYPNPFNPTTNITFNIPSVSKVRLTVFNVLGQKVATLIDGKTLNAGAHTVGFNASSLSSGVYIYRLEAGNFISNKRMTLIK